MVGVVIVAIILLHRKMTEQTEEYWQFENGQEKPQEVIEEESKEEDY